MTTTKTAAQAAEYVEVLREIRMEYDSPRIRNAIEAAIAALSPQATGGELRETYAGMPIDEAIRLGKRYAKDHDKLSPRLAQTLESLTAALIAALSPAIAPAGDALDRAMKRYMAAEYEWNTGTGDKSIARHRYAMREALNAAALPAAGNAVDDAMVERATAAHWANWQGTDSGYAQRDQRAMRAALTAALAAPQDGEAGYLAPDGHRYPVEADQPVGDDVLQAALDSYAQAHGDWLAAAANEATNDDRHTFAMRVALLAAQEAK